VVPDAGRSLGREEIATGQLKEFQDGLVPEGRRIRDVHDDLCAMERFRQPFAGHGVDA
jgi:hypothetical protein